MAVGPDKQSSGSAGGKGLPPIPPVPNPPPSPSPSALSGSCPRGVCEVHSEIHQWMVGISGVVSDIRERIAAPLWARAITTVLFVLLSGATTWSWARAERLNDELTAVKVRQEGELRFLNEELKPLLEQLRQSDQRTAIELAEIKAALKVPGKPGGL